MDWRTLPLCTILLACSGGPPSDGTRGTPSGDAQTLTGPRPDTVAEGQGIPLWSLPFETLEVPARNRESVPDPIPIDGPWRYTGTTKRGMHRFERTLPFRPRGLFFNNPEPGLSLTAAGKSVPYDRFGSRDGYQWFHDRDTLLVYRPERVEPPDGTLALSYAKATTRERALNYEWAAADHEGELAKSDFAWTNIQDGWNSRRGLLLPAPGTASWRVTVPPAAELHFVSGLVEPEVIDSTTSDGATLIVEVTAGGDAEVVHQGNVQPGSFGPQRIDLSRWSGQTVTLAMRTDPAGSTTADYAFIAEPVVASRVSKPRRVIMVFIDTLRPDRMSLYGYERDTTAKLDQELKGNSVVFTQARSVAPWTLPSARTIVTGREPEAYAGANTLQGQLRDEGWATAFLAGNVYLSANFDMHRDWDLHQVGLWPPASQMTDQALSWLEAHDGRNAVIQVHYMDPHLPYVEPEAYRTMYANPEPQGGLREEFHLSEVRRANLAKRKDEAGKTWIGDRYDNNVRYATDEVARLIEGLDDDDIVLIYADHGEELFDHDNFEHGHTLFDELLRVPLVVRAPGLTAATIDTPVSLLDIAPTVLDLVGAPVPEAMEGRSLVPLAKGEPEAVAVFSRRDLAFGRPLYGMERWGLLHGTKKWTTHEGREALYDVGEDPLERSNLMLEADEEAGGAYRHGLATAVGRDVVVSWRLATTNFKGRSAHELKVLCSVPGGFEHVWVGALPLMNAKVSVTEVDAATLTQSLTDLGFTSEDHPTVSDSSGFIATYAAPKTGAAEVFMVPKRPKADVGHALRCSGLQNDKRATMQIPAHRNPGLSPLRIPMDRIQFEETRQLVLQLGITPLPAEGTIDGTDDEMTDALKAIGYVDPDEE